MVRITPGQNRLAESSYHYYSQPLAGEHHLLIRRRLANPNDTIHPSSQQTALQRNRIAKAAKDYHNLPYIQKDWWRKNIEWSPQNDLLKGYQLYVSTHVAAQRTREDVETPPFEPPITRLPACIQTTTAGLQAIEGGELYLRRLADNFGWKKGVYLSPSYFRFDDVPDIFAPSYLRPRNYQEDVIIDKPITTFAQLARRHYARVTIPANIRVDKGAYPYGKYHYFACTQNNPNFTWTDDTYHLDDYHPDVGICRCSYTVKVTDFQELTYALAHDHDNNTLFRWTWGRFTDIFAFICTKDQQGQHHITYCSDKVTPI